jgi:hypothetical protein
MFNPLPAALRFLVIVSACAVAFSAAAGKAIYTRVKFPHDHYTRVEAINNNGAVAGQYGNVASGPAFIRATDGTFTHFAVEGAATTIPRGLTDEGAIGGRYDLPDDSIHGFLRDPAGNLTLFDGPGIMTAEVNGINASNDITGTYFRTKAGEFGGFIRHADGSFTVFKIKEARPEEIHVAGIDDKGEVAGFYIDSKFVAHAFLRNPAGKIRKFQAPDATSRSFGDGSDVLAISSNGWVAGLYTGKNGVHRYLRDPRGKFEEFDLPGGQSNQITDINDSGEITGCYASNNLVHGFVRKVGRNPVTFDLPWGSSQDMCAATVNNSGQVAGYARYGEFNENGFGFIRTP